MAYDLLLRRQTPSIFSRDAPVATNVAGGLGVFAALAFLVVPRARRKIERHSEIRRYRREFDDGLDKTQEMPAVRMADMFREMHRRA